MLHIVLDLTRSEVIDLRNRTIELALVLPPITILIFGLTEIDYILFTLSACLVAIILIRVLFPQGISTTKLTLVSSSALLIFSIIALIFQYDVSMDRSIWAHSMGVVYWLITFPMAALALETMTSLARAKLNFPLIAGFMAFISGALITLTMVVVSYMNGADIDDMVITSMDLLSVLFMNFVLSFVAAIILSFILKKRRFILSGPEKAVKQ